jgi:uncharacterized protein with HEPN domain
MSDSTEREWRFYLDDMIGFAERAIAYTEGLDQTAFVASGLNYDATVRNLELIGEAATRIPEGVRAANPQLPWRLVIATRNRLTESLAAPLLAATRKQFEQQLSQKDEEITKREQGIRDEKISQRTLFNCEWELP